MLEKNDKEIDSGATECPDRNRLIAFVERRLDARQSEEVARHLFNCKACRKFVRLYAQWMKVEEDHLEELSPDENALVRDIAAKALQRARQKVVENLWKDVVGVVDSYSSGGKLAADGQNPQTVIANRSGYSFFKSRDTSPEKAWSVCMPHSTSNMGLDTVIDFQVADINGDPVPSGVLTFGGAKLIVKDGFASTEVRNLKDEMIISFQRDGGEDVVGDPVPSKEEEGV